MKSRKIFTALALTTAFLLTSCGSTANTDTASGSTEETTEDKSSAEETSKEESTTEGSANKEDEKMYEAQYTDLTVENGENTIFGRLYAPTEDGKYPAIILSHGYNGSFRDWKNECKYYAEHGIAAYAYDFCGGSTHSKSTGATTDMTIFTEKSDLLAVYDKISSLDNVDPERVFLMGGSQGGFVTTLAVEELSDKVKGMILYFPALCVPDNWRDTYKNEADIPDEVDFWGMMLGGNFFKSIRDFQVFDEIGKYSGPVTIFHGDQDQIVPLSYSEKAAELYPNAELTVLPGEGHGFSSGASKEVMEKVLAFMKNNL